MCGICGFISKKDIRLDELIKMNDTMYHRGPDDHGEEIYPLSKEYRVGLAQRRLSILDLSALGHQPMHSKDGRITVVFNGEIYNYIEIKNELSDYEFHSTCDTEVIIASYLKWGIKAVDKFRGMFAIAILDRKTEELFLIRDRIGKKPLYYWLDNSDLYFASELKPFMAYRDFKKEIREDVLSRYLCHQYINGPETIFKNVFKLEPGGILRFQKGEIAITKYWSVQEIYGKYKNTSDLSYEEAKLSLKKILERSVKERMIADVPLGTFLSGGYDSSLITALAQGNSRKPINTFSIGFHEEKYNEAKYAKEISQYLGTQHTEMYIDEKSMLELVDSIPIYYDEPFADSSQIPTMLVAKLAREKVTVALSGDGGDEVFCGYNIYDKIIQAQKLDMLGGTLHGISNLPLIKNLKLVDKLPFPVRVIANNRDPECKTQIISEYYLQLAQNLVIQKGLPCQYMTERNYNESNWQERRMLLDMDTYLPGDILCKVDRASMKYSLETRCPILDVNVMQFAYSIPHKYKYHNGNKKRILKDIAYDLVPRELLDRPKVGFSVPMDKWLHGSLREQLEYYGNETFLKHQGLFNVQELRNLIKLYLEQGDGGASSGKNFSKIVWSFFIFQKWYEHYIVPLK